MQMPHIPHILYYTELSTGNILGRGSEFLRRSGLTQGWRGCPQQLPAMRNLSLIIIMVPKSKIFTFLAIPGTGQGIPSAYKPTYLTTTPTREFSPGCTK